MYFSKPYVPIMKELYIFISANNAYNPYGILKYVPMLTCFNFEKSESKDKLFISNCIILGKI